MANPFITSAKKLIYRNGIDATFTKVIEGTYNSDTGSVTNTETTKVVKVYPKVITANAYNFPSLINKEMREYLVVSEDLGYKPEAQDKIAEGTAVYSVVSVKDIVARNESVIYIVAAVKG